MMFFVMMMLGCVMGAMGQWSSSNSFNRDAEYYRTIKEHLQDAKEGKLESQVKVAAAYEFLHKWEDAVLWYTKAAEQGHKVSMRKLFLYYYWGRKVYNTFPQNIEMANKWAKKFRETPEEKKAPEPHIIGLEYGALYKYDIAKIEEKCLNGKIKCSMNLAMIYFFGYYYGKSNMFTEIPKDYQKVRKYLDLYLSNGEVDGTLGFFKGKDIYNYIMGYFNYHGITIPKNYSAAFNYWNKISSVQIASDSIRYKLALMAFKGEGVSKNFDSVAKFLVRKDFHVSSKGDTSYYMVNDTSVIYFDFMINHNLISNGSKYIQDKQIQAMKIWLGPKYDEIYRRLEYEYNGNVPKPPVNNSFPIITFQNSVTTVTKPHYNLNVCVKSASKIIAVVATLNGNDILSERGIEPSPNDGCDYVINRNITLKEGQNIIIVSVSNLAGPELKSLTVVYNSGKNLPLPPQSTEKRIALVVGNANYQNQGKLNNPENDANDIATKLERLGFLVILRNNLNKEQFGNAISDFGRQAKNYNVALFFYAGHGIQSNGINYLIPTDAKIVDEYKVQYECINAGLVLKAIENVNKKIIILDACRNNPFARSWLGRGPEDFPGLAIMNAPDATFIAYSTSPNTTAADGFGRNSPYATALLEVLTERCLSISDVFMKVNQKVRTATNNKQKPWTSNSFYENFIFNKCE